MEIHEMSKEELKKDKEVALSSFGNSVKRSIQKITKKPKNWRKTVNVFRFFFVSVLIGCFVYQVTQFLAYILEYPTIVNIDIIDPPSFLSPAFTVCNNERIKRSLYCERYTDRCVFVEPGKKYCTKFTRFCGLNKTKVPRNSYLDKKLSPDEIFELGFDFEDIWKINTWKSGVLGEPQKMLRSRSSIYEFSVCYNLGDRTNSPLEAPYIYQEESIEEVTYFGFEFHPHIEDGFEPRLKSGIYFSLHSPFDSVNPIEDGLFLQMGKYYKIKVFLEERKLLPFPYKTDCMNYTETWIKNNYTGPRSEKSCREKCVADTYEFCGLCMPLSIMYPSKQERCIKEEVNDTLSPCLERYNLEEKTKECSNNCKKECSTTKFTLEVKELFFNLERRSRRPYEDYSKIYVDIQIQNTDVFSYTHRPQFQDIETFSYIGGFIGIWLGVSIVHVTDFLRSSLIYCYKFYKKMNSKNLMHV